MSVSYGKTLLSFKKRKNSQIDKFISEIEEPALAPTGNANTWILQKSGTWHRATANRRARPARRFLFTSK
jgi:hypothetical protein